jgi:hypothetical protein
MPGEKVISECKPFYATSKRIIRYDEGAQSQPVAEIGYHQLAAVELMRKPSHPMMALGTLCILAAIFLAASSIIIVTAIPALIVGVVLLAIGARGNLGYYQLRIRETHTPAHQAVGADQGSGSTINTLIESLGLRTPPEEARWRVDYARAGSFLATIRVITGELPGL